MADEDAEVGVGVEAVLDPAVVLAPDLALVDVGLRRVDRDERDLHPVELEPEPVVARAERLLVEDVAHVPRVVIPRDEDDVLALDPAELLARLLVLLREAVVGEVARDDDEIRPRLVHLGDRGVQELAPVPAGTDVHVGELRDQHRTEP